MFCLRDRAALALAILAFGAGLTGCGSSDNGVASKSASEILAATRAAAQSASAVHIVSKASVRRASLTLNASLAKTGSHAQVSFLGTGFEAIRSREHHLCQGQPGLRRASREHPRGQDPAQHLAEGARDRDTRASRRIHQHQHRATPPALRTRDRHQGAHHQDQRRTRDRTQTGPAALHRHPLCRHHRPTIPNPPTKDRPRNRTDHLHRLERPRHRHPADQRRRDQPTPTQNRLKNGRPHDHPERHPDTRGPPSKNSSTVHTRRRPGTPRPGFPLRDKPRTPAVTERDPLTTECRGPRPSPRRALTAGRAARLVDI